MPCIRSVRLQQCLAQQSVPLAWRPPTRPAALMLAPLLLSCRRQMGCCGRPARIRQQSASTP